MTKWTREQFNENVLLLMALPQESQGLFEKAGFSVHYTGIGKINATQKITEMILQKKPQWILNLGTAGSHRLQQHELIECSAFVDRDVDMSPVGAPRGRLPGDEIILKNSQRITELKQGICGSGDHLEIGVPKIECDLMDMESFALAKVAQRYKIPFVSIKYISDNSDLNLKSNWKQNLAIASENLFQVLQKLVSN